MHAQEKLDDAVACYRQALALKPDSAAIVYNLGNTLQAQEKLDDATACYKRALVLRPDYAEATTTWAASSTPWVTWMKPSCGTERPRLCSRTMLRLVSASLWRNCVKAISPPGGAITKPVGRPKSTIPPSEVIRSRFGMAKNWLPGAC
jgi:tetratricopeptide (TPR) repeat protein